MAERVITSLLVAGMLLAVGLAIGAVRREAFSLKWLLGSVLLLLVHDAVATNGYWQLPDVLWESRWNWQGKLLSFAALLALAAHPAFGWREVGWTLRHREGSLRAVAPFVALYAALFAGLALLSPPESPDFDTVAFQLTMPSLEEELFYRGVLLFALYKAFAGRIRFAGVAWSWGAVLASAAFGLDHAFRYADGAASVEWLYFAATAVPSLAGVWVRLRTGSLAIPVAMHTFGNTASYFL